MISREQPEKYYHIPIYITPVFCTQKSKVCSGRTEGGGLSNSDDQKCTVVLSFCIRVIQVDLDSVVWKSRREGKGELKTRQLITFLLSSSMGAHNEVIRQQA